MDERCDGPIIFVGLYDSRFSVRVSYQHASLTFGGLFKGMLKRNGHEGNLYRIDEQAVKLPR